MKYSICIKIATAAFLLNYVSNIGFAEKQLYAMRLSDKYNERFKADCSSVRSSVSSNKLIAQEKDKFNKSRQKKKSAENGFQKLMQAPAKIAKNGNDQLKRKYGVDIGMRDNHPVLERSVKF